MRIKRRTQAPRVQFASGGCAENCCVRPEGPSEARQRNTQDCQVEPQGSNLGLPPVADNDRQTLHAEHDQDSIRHHVESKPQTLATRLSQMSGKGKVEVRRAQRFVEKTTGMSRTETDQMTDQQLMKLESIMNAEAVEKKAKELEAEKQWVKDFDELKLTHESGCVDGCECGGDVASEADKEIPQ